MKYIVRVIKYFIYVSIIMALILWILSLLHIVDGNPEVMFRNGYKSLWQIALMFLAVAAVYPRFGFTSRAVALPGSFEELRGGITAYMEEHGYRLEHTDGEDMTFVLRAPLRRALKMWEDRITMTRELPGYRLEGISKDVVRLSAGLQYKFTQE